MKKMKLQMLSLSVNDLLSREQMKTIIGGSGSGGGSGQEVCSATAYCGMNSSGAYISVTCSSTTPNAQCVGIDYNHVTCGTGGGGFDIAICPSGLSH